MADDEGIKKLDDEKIYYRDVEFPDYYIASPCSEEGKKIINLVNTFLKSDANTKVKLRINPYYKLDILVKIPEDAENVVSQTDTSKCENTKKSSDSGLLSFVNSFLHFFGLALGYNYDPPNRGFTKN